MKQPAAPRCARQRAHTKQPPDAGDWLLRRADALAGFVAGQRSARRRAGSLEAWREGWAALAADGEAACSALDEALAAAAAAGAAGAGQPLPEAAAQLRAQLADGALRASRERAALAAQAQELRLAARQACAGTDAAASLAQERAWMRADVAQQARRLGAAAQQLIEQLPPLAGGSAAAGCRPTAADGSCANDDEDELSADGGGELADALRRHPLAPADLRQRLAEQHAEAAARHAAQRSSLLAQLRQALDARPPGLSDDASLLFVWLRGRLLRGAAAQRGGAALGSAALLERVALAMPGASPQQLAGHAAWHDGCVLAQRRLDAAGEDARRERAAILTAAAGSLAQAAEEAVTDARAAASRLATAVDRQLLHGQLSGLALLRQGLAERASCEAARAAAAAAKDAARAAAARTQRTAQQRAQVQDHKARLAQERAAAEAATDRQKLAAAAATQAAAAAARPVVERRQADAEQRRAAVQEARRVQREAEAAREARLAAVAASLAPQDVERDAARARGPTACSSCAAPPVVGAAFRPLHGFDTAQVVSDPRFRLVEALRATGVAGAVSARHGAHLRAAMAKLQGAPASDPSVER